MAQWGTVKKFGKGDSFIDVVCSIETTPFYRPADSNDLIEKIVVIEMGGKPEIIDRLVTAVDKKYLNAPYKDWLYNGGEQLDV